MHHVIIGAGPAGVVAAETLRKTDRSAKVTIVGDEPEAPYSRMALPYYLVGNIKEEGTYLRKTASHFADNNIDVVQDLVEKVDAGAKQLTLKTGGAMAYDKLLVASGSHPASPPIAGIDLAGVHTCWTLEDARAITAKAKPGASVLLMGAGFIGCIILEALVASGANLTVVEMGDRMVPRMMNDIAGNQIKRWCESKGVTVHTSTKVDAIEQSGAQLQAKFSNGQSMQADLIIQATGVRSNIGFLDGSGIDTDFGVKVNDRLQSSNADVYAAGDVAQGLDFSTGNYSVQAIQPTAADHGRIAAMNMAGRDVRHQGSVNMNVLDTIGLVSCSFGLWEGVAGGQSAEVNNHDNYRYLNLQFQDDVLVGASSLGHTAHVGVLRGLIQSKVKLGKWADKLREDPTRIMEAYIATSQAIGANAYAYKLAPVSH